MHIIVVEIKIDNVDIIKVLRLPHLQEQETATESSGEEDDNLADNEYDDREA